MTIDLPKRVADNIASFTGRGWLLPTLGNWWQAGNDRIFLLTGGPGTGKSMVMAWLAGFGPLPRNAEARQQLLELRAAVKAAHFCQASSRNTSPQAFAESIANQLAASVPGFGDALARTLADRVQITGQVSGTVQAGGVVTAVSIGHIDLGALGDDESFDRAFTRPLKQLYGAGHRAPLLLLVDSLDEAHTYGGKVKLADILAGLDDLPPQVRLIATSRDEPRVLKVFHPRVPFDLIKDAPPGADDVRPYAKARLAERATVSAQTRADFAQRLADSAKGVFLYAALVVDELLARREQDLPALDTYALPAGLAGLYHAFLTRELGKNEQRWFDVYERLLGLIAVAQGEGVSATRLSEIIGADLRADLRIVKQYLTGELPDGPFLPFHKSFADFLLEDASNDDFHIDAAAMHRRFGEHLLRAHRGAWAECDDSYALRYTALHLYESARGARERETLIGSLVELVGDKAYQERCVASVANVPMLLQHLERAVEAATWSASERMLPAIAKSACGLVNLRRTLRRGESVIALAESGDVDGALERLALFADLDQDWQAAGRLIVGWLALAANPAGATRLHTRVVQVPPQTDPLLLLAQRLAAALAGQQNFACEERPPRSLEEGRQLVRRLSGQTFDRSLMIYGHGQGATMPLAEQQEFIAARKYASVLDGPVLTNIARAFGAEGTALIDEYVGAHAGYNYVEYRNRSLWILLEGVLRHHPDQAWVRERLKRILLSALSGGGVEFTEAAPLTATALLVRRTHGAGHPVVNHYAAQADALIGRLASRRGANDSWSLHKRRLLALLEAQAMILADPAAAAQTWARIEQLERDRILEGFAGFQAPAELRAADTLCATRFGAPPLVGARIERALHCAHHIQDPHFCARITARCNTLSRWHALGLTGAALVGAIDRLVKTPRAPEFAADHRINEAYVFRELDVAPEEQLSIDSARQANTLRDLAEIFERTEADILRLNPGFGLTAPLAAGTPVKVPDPGLLPLLAVHFSARVLGEPGASAAQRASLVRRLVPTAAANPTSLDSVLSFLLIAAQPNAPDVLAELTYAFGPLVLVDAGAPVGQIGPDAAIPA